MAITRTQGPLSPFEGLDLITRPGLVGSGKKSREARNHLTFTRFCEILQLTIEQRLMAKAILEAGPGARATLAISQPKTGHYKEIDMAERIEAVMARGNMEVTHEGETITVDLPQWFRVPEDVWYSEEALIEWCRDHGILLANLHKGFEQTLIKLRAVARPADKPPEEKGGNPIKQKIEQSAAQDRVFEFRLKPRQRPAESFSAEDQFAKLSREVQIAALRKAGFSEKQIEALMSAE